MSYGKIYLSGPMSTLKQREKMDNITQRLTNLQHTVHNPNTTPYTETIYNTFPAEGYRYGIHQLLNSNSMFLVENWETARGCISEILTAGLAGIPIYEITHQPGLQIAYLPITKENVGTKVAELLMNQNTHHQKH